MLCDYYVNSCEIDSLRVQLSGIFCVCEALADPQHCKEGRQENGLEKLKFMHLC